MRIKITDKAKRIGFHSVEQVRKEICSRYAEYDTCSVCLYWTVKEHCTLLKEVPEDAQ